MTNWKTFDVNNPPTNWCLVEARVRIRISKRRFYETTHKGAIMARWSRSNYCWINMDLLPQFKHEQVIRYLELDYPTLNDMIYNVRPKRPAPKVYGENG